MSDEKRTIIMNTMNISEIMLKMWIKAENLSQVPS